MVRWDRHLLGKLEDALPALLVEKVTSLSRNRRKGSGMEYQLARDGEIRLAAYFDRIGGVMRPVPQRTSFATYALGLMDDGERESAEPIAAPSCPDPDRVDAAHQRLTYFTRGREGADQDVRKEAAIYALAAMTARQPVTDWIIDDTAFRSRVRTRWACSDSIRAPSARLPIAGGGQLEHRHTHGVRAGGLLPYARELDRVSVASRALATCTAFKSTGS
jgi:SRSO17 transposase